MTGQSLAIALKGASTNFARVVNFARHRDGPRATDKVAGCGPRLSEPQREPSRIGVKSDNSCRLFIRGFLQHRDGSGGFLGGKFQEPSAIERNLDGGDDPDWCEDIPGQPNVLGLIKILQKRFRAL